MGYFQENSCYRLEMPTWVIILGKSGRYGLMYSGKMVFSQVMDFLPLHAFRRSVKKYEGNRYVKSFSCMDQFLCMAFAQLSYRESLRDIESCLRAMTPKLYHMGIRGKVSRSTLADANEKRDWRIYAEFAYVLIDMAKDLYAGEDFGLELKETVYALDASTIDLCLSLFPWARFRKTKAAIKLHTLLDLRGNIPSFISITEGNIHEVKILDELLPEPGAFYIMDRGYLDFKRLYLLNQLMAFFVIRAKRNMRFRRLYSHKVDKSTGLRCDQIIRLTGQKSSVNYPEKLRRVNFFDAATERHLSFLTNNFMVPALIISELYRSRWQIELFFKWMKQHLRIKAFYGTSENAVKTQIWIAVSVYVLVAIIRKRLGLDAMNLYTILQVLSVTLFEKIQLTQILTNPDYKNPHTPMYNQLKLFDF